MVKLSFYYKASANLRFNLHFSIISLGRQFLYLIQEDPGNLHLMNSNILLRIYLHHLMNENNKNTLFYVRASPVICIYFFTIWIFWRWNNWQPETIFNISWFTVYISVLFIKLLLNIWGGIPTVLRRRPGTSGSLPLPKRSNHSENSISSLSVLRLIYKR